MHCAALGLLIAALGGCRPGSTAKPAPAAPTASAAKTASSRPADASPAKADTPKAEGASAAPAPPANVPSGEPPSANRVDPGEPAKSEAKASHEPRASRVAILTPGGPLLMDVKITIGGRPLNELFEKRIDEVLQAADTDHDQRSTWKELVGNEAYLKDQQQGNARNRAQEAKMWKDRYDFNHDSTIQREEAAAWLGRATGRTVRAFDVRSSRSYFSVPSASSRIWKLLDADGDGQLSAAELDSCAKSLLALDADDDGIVSSAELTSLREQLRADAGRNTFASRAGNPFAALYLEPEFAADRLEYLLTELYAPQQNLQPANFSDLAAQFQPLDVNSDGWLDQDEMARLLTGKPHLKLAVNFAPTGTKGDRTVSLVIGEHIPKLALVVQPAADRTVLQLGTTRLVISAHDLTIGLPPAEGAAASEIRLMVHDQCDALGELLDADADGQLGEREIATSGGTLLKYDANHDGQLQNNELPYTMIVAVLRGELPDESSFYRPRSDLARASQAGAPSWFKHADFNGDGDISRREFLGTDEQFSRLDANDDGFISAAEANAAEPTKATGPVP
jgi:Ca2+-binding EF-hand superfamily protein